MAIAGTDAARAWRRRDKLGNVSHSAAEAVASELPMRDIYDTIMSLGLLVSARQNGSATAGLPRDRAMTVLPSN